MEKLKVGLHTSPELLEKRAKMREELLNDPEIREMLQRNGLDAAAIDYKIGRLMEYRRQKQACADCRGLGACPLAPAGIILSLAVREGHLELAEQPCQYLKQKQDFDEYQGNYLYSDLGPLEQRLSFIEMSKHCFDDQGPDYLLAVKQLREWGSSDLRKGFFLAGPTGCGKTSLLAGIANDLARKGRKIAFFNMSIMSQTLRSGILNSEEMHGLIEAMNSADVTVYDNIGNESVTNLLRDEILIPSLDYRLSRQKAVVLAGNYRPDELTRHYSYTIFGDFDEKRAQYLVNRIKMVGIMIELPQRTASH